MFRGLLFAFLLGVTQGCYVYPAVTTAPAPGRQLRFELNDRGRVGLGESIGSSAAQLEGVLQSDTDSAYSVKVLSVTYLNGQTNRWNAEPLLVPKTFVRDVKQREFSRSRSFLTAAAAVGGAVLLVITRGLLGSGTPDTDKGPPGGGGENFR